MRPQSCSCGAAVGCSPSFSEPKIPKGKGFALLSFGLEHETLMMTSTKTPQEVSGGFWVFKNFQKPPVGGYWYIVI